MNPNMQCLYLVIGHDFDWPFTKKFNIFNIPKIKSFISNAILSQCFPLAHL